MVIRHDSLTGWIWRTSVEYHEQEQQEERGGMGNAFSLVVRIMILSFLLGVCLPEDSTAEGKRKKRKIEAEGLNNNNNKKIRR